MQNETSTVGISQVAQTILDVGVHVEGRITSRSGRQQNWLVDLRSVLMEAEALSAICREFWDQHADVNDVHIAGMESAAIPLVTGLVLEGAARGKRISGLMIRKSRKKTGLGRLIEGNVQHASAILVDDILNSGGAAEKARTALLQAGITVQSVFVVVDYRSYAGMSWRDRNKLSVSSLLTLSDLGLSLAGSSKPTATVRYENAWYFMAPGGFPYYTVPKSAPLLIGQHLYFGSDSAEVWCLNADTGAVIWSFQAPACGRKGIWSSPAYDDGCIFIGAYNGNFYCLDAATGQLVWEQALCEWIGSSPVVSSKHGLVYVGLEYARPRAQGSIVALSLKTGEKVWEKLLRVFQHGSGAYSTSQDTVVFGTNDHNVLALDAASGKVRWRFDTRRSVKYAPAIDEQRGIVSFASFDGSIYVLNLADGKKLAEFPTGNICYTTPLLKDGRLFCGSGDKYLYVADLDVFRITDRIDQNARVYSSPRQIDNAVIFGTSGGAVREIDSTTLELRGEIFVPDAVANAVAVSPDGSKIFVPTVMNEIYAYHRIAEHRA